MGFQSPKYNTPWRCRRPIVTLVCVITFIFAFPSSTWAHPLGNFTVNRYSRLAPGAEQIELHYVVDMAEIPAFQERAQMDTSRDSVLSQSEQAQYLANQVATLQSNLHLLAGGMALKLEPQESSLEFLPGQGGLSTLRLSINFTAALPQEQQVWQVEYRDDNYTERLGWQEIVVQTTAGVSLLESTAPTQDISQELRSYPQDLLQNPLKVSSASFRFERQSDGTIVNPALATQAILASPWSAPQSPDGQNPKSSDPFATLIAIPRLGPEALLLALLAAFGWGAAHALSPGHGKTIVAAYLVGSRGTMRHAIFLGLTTTLTHTVGVFTLGGITLLVSKFILPEQLYPWLGVASGLLVVTIGLSLLMGRLRGGHSHAHDHDPHDDHDHFITYHGSHLTPHHHNSPGPNSATITWRNLLALGVSGGLLPCPAALVVMLGAIALQRIGFGLLLIFIFSLGLASVLTIIGILFVHAGRLLERLPLNGRLTRVLPIVSSVFVTIAGLGITWQALAQAGILPS